MTADTQYNKLQFHTSDEQKPENKQELKYFSGYVEPNSMEIENKSATKFFPSVSQAANANKTTSQKPVVISTSNGAGIVRVGTLQAVIPSNHTFDDVDDFRIVPSPKHESYVDVVM